MLNTSAQDQFAKWAKLRRSVDKGLADLEKLSECLPSLGKVTEHRAFLPRKPSRGQAVFGEPVTNGPRFKFSPCTLFGR